MVVLFSNNNHYSLLAINTNNKKNDINDIKKTPILNININKEKIEVKKEILVNNNKLCFYGKDKDYYDNIYNYIISFEINTKKGKTNWKKVVYPKNLFKADDNNKQLKDKRRQDYRIKCLNYRIINNALFYIKKENEEKIFLRTPLQIEKEQLLYNLNIKQGHIGYIRLYNK